jgi:hypothetical protein
MLPGSDLQKLKEKNAQLSQIIANINFYITTLKTVRSSSTSTVITESDEFNRVSFYKRAKTRDSAAFSGSNDQGDMITLPIFPKKTQAKSDFNPLPVITQETQPDS